MYALCVSGAVNTQGFVWKSLCATYTFSFIHSSLMQKPQYCCVMVVGHCSLKQDGEEKKKTGERMAR